MAILWKYFFTLLDYFIGVASNSCKNSLVLLLLMSFVPAPVRPGVPAFPGAEGFGAMTIGGRGGRVIEVINLNDSGPGSLRAAVEAAGLRIVIFRISGTIALASELTIRQSYITIAGQTAPGDGICLKDNELRVEADQVIVRFLRCRPGDKRRNGDAITVNRGHHVIIDHASTSWGDDETLTVSSRGGIDSVTVQWCIIAESPDLLRGEKGHGYGSLIRGSHGEQYTFHHNLYAHHSYRNPWVGNYLMPDEDPTGLYFDFRNNVIYNWGGDHASANSKYRYSGLTKVNFVGNYYKRGSNSTGDYCFLAAMTWGRGYFQDNFMNGSRPEDPWSLVKWGEFTEQEKTVYKQARPFPAPPVTMQPAPDAFKRVLAEAGASLPKRDAVDERIVQDVRNGTGRIVDTMNDVVDGWPALQSAPAPADQDHDGMPDAWEKARGLNPADPADGGADRDGDGYTNVEEYLNSFCPDMLPRN